MCLLDEEKSSLSVTTGFSSAIYQSSLSLPIELEREICEMAVLGDWQCLVQVLRVARRFHQWFQPEMYRALRSGSDGIFYPPFYVGIDKWKHGPVELDISFIERFGRHVKYLLLQRRPVSEVAEILSRCPNITYLSLWWLDEGSKSDLIPHIDNLKKLTRLSMDFSAIFNGTNDCDDLIPFDRPTFRNVTHVELINSPRNCARIVQLAALPNLTHVCVGGNVMGSVVIHILEICLHLKVLILFKTFSGHIKAAEWKILKKDVRLVIPEGSKPHFEDWESGVRGKDDFWVMGERLKEVKVKEIAERAVHATVDESIQVN